MLLFPRHPTPPPRQAFYGCLHPYVASLHMPAPRPLLFTTLAGLLGWCYLLSVRNTKFGMRACELVEIWQFESWQPCNIIEKSEQSEDYRKAAVAVFCVYIYLYTYILKNVETEHKYKIAQIVVVQYFVACHPFD